MWKYIVDKLDKEIRRMGKAKRAHQSQSVPMGTGFRPLPIIPKNPNSQPFQDTSKNPQSKSTKPQIPDIQFKRTILRRYDTKK
jgi:hypothetical protein